MNRVSRVSFFCNCLALALGSSLRAVDASELPQGVERVEIFLLMGQSYMKGRGNVPETQTIHPRILNMNMGDDLWYSAKHPLHKTGVPDPIDGSDNSGVGPGLDFGSRGGDPVRVFPGLESRIGLRKIRFYNTEFSRSE